MKKWLFLIGLIASTQMAYADDTANIRIKISGASSDNRYFLCLPDVGCLSILGAQRGKVFPIYRQIAMGSMFVGDIKPQFHITPQSVPASCRGTVDVNHTVTISGQLLPGSNKVTGLHCTIS